MLVLLCVTPDGGKEEKGERRGRKGQNKEEADSGGECYLFLNNQASTSDAGELTGHIVAN